MHMPECNCSVVALCVCACVCVRACVCMQHICKKTYIMTKQSKTVSHDLCKVTLPFYISLLSHTTTNGTTSGYQYQPQTSFTVHNCLMGVYTGVVDV